MDPVVLLGQIPSMVVGGIESISSHETYRVREDGPRYGECWCDAYAWYHRHFHFFGYEARIHLNPVWMFVQMTQVVGNLGIRVDAFERVVRLEAEELAELIERRKTPFTRLDDPKYLDRAEGFWNIVRTEGAWKHQPM